MDKLSKMPTWPEFAKEIVRMHLDSVKRLNQAIQSGDKKEITDWKKLVSQTEAMVKKNRITINLRSQL